MNRPTAGVVGAVAALALTAGCTGSSGGSGAAASPSPTGAAACTAVATTLVGATQRYIDGFSLRAPAAVGPAASPTASGTATATPTATPTTSPTATATSTPVTTALSEQEFTAAVDAARQRLGALGCDTAAFRADVGNGLRQVRSNGPVAAAVLAQLEVSLTGKLGDQPVTRALTPKDDLTAALAEAPPGSTLTLAAGTYRLPETLVLLRAVTLRGAGRDRTILTGAAADATVLVMTDAAIALRDLAVVRPSGTPGSGIVTGATAALTLTGVRVRGATTDSGGAGGAGVLLSATQGDAPDPRTTTLTVRDSEFLGNASAGIAVGGWHRVDVTGSLFVGNHQCGICFLGASDGSVTTSRFRGNGAGAAAGGEARPSIRANTISGGQIGVQAGDSAAPVVLRNTFVAPGRAAMLYTGQAAGRIDGNTCPSDRVGIAVAKTAYPYVGHNSCGVTVAG